MKRLLALLLCLSLFLPVFALGEEEDDWSMQEEDVELDENGNLIIRDEDTGEAFVIKTGTETEEELIEQYAVDENIDYSELEMNENLPDNIVNILLIGVDVRGNKNTQLLRDQVGNASSDVKLCDVVMILSIDKDEGTIKLTSIARDTKVEIPGQGMHKINFAFGIRHYKNGQYHSFTDKPDSTSHPQSKMNLSSGSPMWKISCMSLRR